MARRRTIWVRAGQHTPPTGFRLTAVAWLAMLGFAVFPGCAVRSQAPDLAAQVAAARAPADHAAVARTLLAEATKYAEAAAYHRSLAAKYENLAGSGAQYRGWARSDLRMAEHCRTVAEDLEHAARDLTQLAREHERLAGLPQGEKQ